jgi:hypothetical protein
VQAVPTGKNSFFSSDIDVIKTFAIPNECRVFIEAIKRIISKSDVKLKHMEYNYFFFVVLAIKNGREISRFTGAADENRIQKMIDQLSR